MPPPVFRTLAVVCLTLPFAACGGSGVGPTATPTPPPVTHPVTVTAFYDENANGVFDPTEGTRIPGAEIVIGSARGTTAVLTGQATLQAPEGAQTITVTASSLAPFYRPPTAPIQITVPSGSNLMVPITLPRGSNRANVYMAFGDSITNGEPEVPDGNGYRNFLQTMLRNHFGAGEVANEGRDATDSDFGAEIITTRLQAVRPSFTLIHVNVGYDGRTPPERQAWVDQQNVYIRQVADQEGAVLVDLNTAFKNSGLSGSALYVDHLHPTTAGYQIMARAWFDAITKAYSKILTAY
jgi:lysophospholipase L1-like esterase